MEQKLYEQEEDFVYQESLEEVFSSDEVLKIRELLFHEDIAFVHQGILLVEALSYSIRDIFHCLGAEVPISKWNWYEQYLPSDYLRLWLLGILIKEQIPWILDVSVLYIGSERDLNESERLFDIEEKPTELHLEVNCLEYLPDNIGLWYNLKELYLRDCGLCFLAEEIGQLVNLETLDLRSNQLRVLPKSIGKLEKLRELNLSYNDLNSLPKELSDCAVLTRLNVTGNFQLT